MEGTFGMGFSFFDCELFSSHGPVLTCLCQFAFVSQAHARSAVCKAGDFRFPSDPLNFPQKLCYCIRATGGRC